MAEKICCPGPLGTSGGNTASGGAFREAVCVHTSKVYDSCRSKECLRDIRVYLTRDAQDMLDSGGIVSVKPRTPALQSYTQKNHRLSAVVFPSHLNTDKPFGALGFLSPDEPPELLLFEPPELFLDSFAAAAAACAAEIVAEVPSP